MLVYLTEKYKNILYESNRVEFRYEIHDKDYIVINNTIDTSITIPIIKYEDTSNIKIFEVKEKYLILEGKNKYTRDIKRKQTMAFKSGNGELTHYDTILNTCVCNVLNLQIFYNINIFYIENDIDVINILNQIVFGINMVNHSDKIQRKSKGCAKTNSDLLRSLLLDIPSVSKEIANSLITKYKSVYGIYHSLSGNKSDKINELSNITVEYKNNTRKIGDSKATQIFEYINNKF